MSSKTINLAFVGLGAQLNTPAKDIFVYIWHTNVWLGKTRRARVLYFII